MSQQKISEEEKKIFRDAVSHIVSFKKNSNVVESKISVRKKQSYFISMPHSLSETISFQNRQHDVTGDALISFFKSGLQNKLIAQFRQGKLPTTASLDLHRYTVAEAIHATDFFLKKCSARKNRYVCIIHGKGTLSKNNVPILKNALNAYLREHPLVLAFHSAKAKHGGAGALYVLIKI